MKDLATQVMFGWPLDQIPKSKIRKLIVYLVQEKDKLIEDGNYLEAQKFEIKIDELRQISTESSYDSIHRGRYDELQQRLETAERDLQMNLEKRDSIIESFQRERQQALDEMEACLQQELISFEAKHDTDPPPKFRKFSPEYLNLRQRERAMIYSKRYVDANNLKAEADILERKEVQQQNRNWERHVAKQRQLLVKRHEEQRRILQEKWDREWAALSPSADQQIKKCENAVRAVESRIMAESEQILPEVAPTKRSISVQQNDRLRSRAAYMRTKNYNEIRHQKVKRHIARMNNPN